MKKVILILAMSLSITGCKKNNSNSPNNSSEAYCVYYYSGSTKVFSSCEKNSSDAASKCQQLRDSGKSAESVKKSSCSDC